ncbi:MAG: class I SAM-dependent methyltransferase [Sandaracinus sp.]
MDRESLGTEFDRESEAWDAFYDDESSGRAFEFRARRDRVLAMVRERVPRGGKVLELGCGTGRAAVELVREGRDVMCTDISTGMLDLATRNVTRAMGPGTGRALGFLRAAAHELDPGVGPVDAVIALGVLDYVEDLVPSLQRVTKLLRPGGFAVLTFSNRLSPSELVEAPVKRGLARALRAVRGASGAVARVAAFAGTVWPRTEAEVRRAYQDAGLTVDEVRAVGMGMRFGPAWVPPRRIVQRLDEAWGEGPLRVAGRTLVVSGRTRAE